MGVFALACQARQSEDGDATRHTPAPATFSTSPDWAPSPNDTGGQTRPTSTGRTRVKRTFDAAAVDQATLAEVQAAILEHNDLALARLRAEGRAFDVVDGDRVEILQRVGRYVHVRMITGPNIGRQGWLPAGSLE
jgi:hypothetical protein